jgi:Derlin-2/3
MNHFDHAGHIYYFLEDVYPRMTGRRPLKTPALIKFLFPADEQIVAPVAVDAPPPAQANAAPPQEEAEGVAANLE